MLCSTLKALALYLKNLRRTQNTSDPVMKVMLLKHYKKGIDICLFLPCNAMSLCTNELMS